VTAERVAIRRAAHQLRDKPRVFDDPLALTILRPEVAAWLREEAEGPERSPLSRYFRADGYVSSDASETYELYDVTTPLASLTDRTGGVAAYTDLGSGTSYGSRAFSAADTGVAPVTITLNAAALANLQAAAGARIGLGGALTTISGIADQYLSP
jgi:hypothetical protein